jgi:hypothetical protein
MIYIDLTPIEANKLAERFVKLNPTILDIPVLFSPTGANVIYHKKVKNNTEYYLASDGRYTDNDNEHQFICKNI